jgi:hypothetical protein
MYNIYYNLCASVPGITPVVQRKGRLEKEQRHARKGAKASENRR